jgi:hypothetical protein
MSTKSKNPTFKVHGNGLTSARESFHSSPDFPLIEFSSVPFDLRRVKLALFDSTYRSPIALLFPKENTLENIASDITMTVELAHAMYEIDESDTPTAECYDTPEWYLRGVAHFTGPTGEAETAPMHVFLTINERNQFESATVQVIRGRDSDLYASEAET